jgi:heptose I phosphotransferase
VYAVPEFADFAGHDWPDRIMDVDVQDRFHAKQGRSIGRWTLTTATGESLTVYLKRHYELPWRCGWGATLCPFGGAWSPGVAEWEHLAWAEEQGLPVPRTIAAGEFRGPWGKLQSFLAVEELTDMLPLHEAIPLAQQHLTAAEFAHWKRNLVTELARLCRELHRRHAYHKDLYLCHFYLSRFACADPAPDFVNHVHMIDFHRLGWHRLTGRWYQVKDLAQLLFSTLDQVPGITARDRLRFWKLYREGDWTGSHRPPQWLRAAIRWKWKLYDRHNRKRAARRGDSHRTGA